jgi:hypothetical protein
MLELSRGWRRTKMTDDKHGPHTVHALLADGTTVCIRPVETGDHEPLQGLYEEMSPENLRLRFFAASRRSAELAADRACAPPRPAPDTVRSSPRRSTR